MVPICRSGLGRLWARASDTKVSRLSLVAVACQEQTTILVLPDGNCRVGTGRSAFRTQAGQGAAKIALISPKGLL